MPVSDTIITLVAGYQGIALATQDNHIVMVSQQFCNITEQSPAILIGLTLERVVSFHSTSDCTVITPAGGRSVACSRQSLQDYDILIFSPRNSTTDDTAERGVVGSVQKIFEAIPDDATMSLIDPFLSSLAHPIWICDEEGVYRYQNAASISVWGNQIGRRADDLVDVLPEDARSSWMENNRRALAGEVFCVNSVNEKCDVISYFSPFKLAGRQSGYIGISVDATEQRKAEAACREQAKLLADLFEFLPDAAFVVSVDGTVLLWNRAMEEMTGVSADDVIGRGNYEHAFRFYGERRPMLIDVSLGESVPDGMYTMLDAGSGTVYGEASRRLSDGETRYYWGKASRLFDDSGRVTGAVELIRDITDAHNRDRALRESEEKFRAIFENMPIGYFRTSVEGSLVDYNPALARIFGYADTAEMMAVKGRGVLAFYSNPADRDEFITELWTNRSVQTREISMKRRDGQLISVSIIARIFTDHVTGTQYIEGTIEDITERLRMEQMMLQSEKMSIVAGLAAGMAHEINNPLGVIMQTAENAERRLLGDIEANERAAADSGTTLAAIADYARRRNIDTYLEEIRKAGYRAATIVQSLLQFSRRSESKLAPMDINAIIRNSVELLHRDYDMRKEYQVDGVNFVIETTGEKLLPCTETQIEQVLLNVMRNAVQALYEASTAHPEIIIRSEQDDKNDVIIRIIDNGPGMTPEVSKRALEPFFTTRDPGKGMGLGLSVSYYIITTMHRGTLRITSAPGAGTTVIIHLPAAGGTCKENGA